MRGYETINDLLNAEAEKNYQFKEWKNKDNLRETIKICCALANGGGGKLILGVTDKRPRKVVGTTAFSQPERTRLDIMNSLKVNVDFKIYDENERVLVFTVAGRPIGLPIQVDGGAWWYHGDSLVLMPEEVRREIYAESGHDFSGDICKGVTIEDLDIDAIETFRKMWMENSGNRRIIGLSSEQLLNDCGAMVNNNVTYAAIILFGKHNTVMKYLPQAEIIFEYRSKETAGPAAQREEFYEGFFVRSYNRIWELVNLRNDKQFYQRRFAVHPISTFNEQVVREAVLNAVSHRNYQLGGSIFVRQYSNKLIIESPGGFPWGISVDNILNRQSARNTLIARIFQLCGLVERSGQGMNLIYEMSIKEAKPLPSFVGSDEYFVKLTLSGKVIDSRMLAFLKSIDEEKLEVMTTEEYILLSTLFNKKEIIDIQSSKFDHLVELGIVTKTDYGIELVSGDSVILLDDFPIETQSIVPIDWQAISIKDRENVIISYIRKYQETSSAEISQITGLSQARVRSILQKLVEEGRIEKVGDYRYAKYRIKGNS